MAGHIAYLENHRTNDGGQLEKHCNRHYKYFPNENPWMPCTDEYFYKNKSSTKDGLNTWCKKCASKSSYEVNQVNYERFLEGEQRYRKTEKCNIADRAKYLRRKEEGYPQKWRANNPDKLKEYVNNHRDHDILESEWIACQEYFNNECAYCGLPSEEHSANRKGKEFIMDFYKEHVDCEGYNDIRNCVPACRSCNSSKREKTLEEFFERTFNKNLTEDRYNKIIDWIGEDYKQYIIDKPPYIIRREKNKNNSKYHWNLWSVDEMRNTIEVLVTGDKKKDLDIHIQRLFPKLE